MSHASHPQTQASQFTQRRRRLMQLFPGPALFASGLPSPRNYPANVYPFRAASHFSYLVGARNPGSFLLLKDGRSLYFTAPPDPEDALWHGERSTLETLQQQLEVDEVRPLNALALELRNCAHEIATLGSLDARTGSHLSSILGRPIEPAGASALLEGSVDASLADAMIQLRLQHDRAALEQLNYAATVSVEAHRAAIIRTRKATTEAELVAAMAEVFHRKHCTWAYNPIVTMHGEILHQEHSPNPLELGQLVLADVGAESPEGWAADITRTWPVNGTFSPTQAAIYELVLGAQKVVIDSVRPGISYRSLHHLALRFITEGLRDLGLLVGPLDDLLTHNVGSLFFPHGIGHLLGLDVHDMEDLGDRAGYAKGRTRSTHFGEKYLRLDRELQEGMLVTVEPGVYFVPAILASAEQRKDLAHFVNWQRVAQFHDVRGIRIEDDVLCTATGAEVLTDALPKKVDDLEALLRLGA